MAQVTGTFAGHKLDGDGARFALTTGITPSRGIAVIAADAVVTPDAGDLVLAHGADAVRLRGMRAQSSRLVRDALGTRLELSLVDRRWRWAYGHVTGVYNEQKEDGTQQQDKTLRQLAALCLDALGESGYEISALPANLYPFVRWEFANPAAALEALLAGRYSVALGADDIVRVTRRGAGATLPAGSVSESAAGRAATAKAESILVRGGRTVREVTVAGLVAVGEETDGSVVPIAGLSYAPAGGWGEEALNGFANIADATARALAEKSVFKWYQLPGGSALPLLDERASNITVNGSPVRLAPVVRGKEDVWDGQTWQSDAVKRVKTGYTLDPKVGLVKFRRMVAKATATDPQGATARTAADLELTYAYALDSGLESDFYTYESGAPGSLQTELIHRPEWVLFQVDSGSGPVDQNLADLDARAAALVNASTESADFAPTRTATYNTIVNLSPDGSIERVEWRVDARSGASTTVMRNPARRVRTQTRGLNPLPKNARAGGGELARDEVEVHGEWRLCKNGSGFDIPANSLVVASGWDVTDAVMTVARPAVADAGPVFLVPNAIKSAKMGRCYETGTHGVIFDATNPSSPSSDPVAVGSRLGAQAASFKAIKSPGGNLAVRAVLRAATVGTPTGLALAQRVSATRILPVIVTQVVGGADYKVKEWGWTGGGVGPEFDAKGGTGLYGVNDITFAVRDAEGNWVLAMAPRAQYG